MLSFLNMRYYELKIIIVLFIISAALLVLYVNYQPKWQYAVFCPLTNSDTAFIEKSAKQGGIIKGIVKHKLNGESKYVSRPFTIKLPKSNDPIYYVWISYLTDTYEGGREFEFTDPKRCI